VLPIGRFGLAFVVATVLAMCSSLIRARGSESLPPALPTPAGFWIPDLAPAPSLPALPATPQLLQAPLETKRLPPTGNAGRRSKLSEANATAEVRGVAQPLRRPTPDRSSLAAQASYASRCAYEAPVTNRNPGQPQPWGAVGAVGTAGTWVPRPIGIPEPKRPTERSWTLEQVALPPLGHASVTPPTMGFGRAPQGLPLAVQPPKPSWPGNPNQSSGQTSPGRPAWTPTLPPRNSWRVNDSGSGPSNMYGGLAARPSSSEGHGSPRAAWTGAPQAPREPQVPPVSARPTSATWQLPR
jgi:hypothetical protein